MPNLCSLQCSDGVQISANRYSVEPAVEAIGSVVVGSALGVPQGFYKGFAEFLNENRFHCLTFDYRGTGESQDVNKKDVQLHQWGEQDIDAAIAYEAQNNGGLPVHFIGHSIGGQVLGLADQAKNLRSIVHVACSQPHWSRGDLNYKLQLMMVGHLMMPLVSLGREDFPSKKVGLASMNIPASCARTWGRWMRNRQYLFYPGFGLNTEGYRQLQQPLVSWSIDDDHMAPYEAVDALIAQYPNAQTEHRVINAKEAGLGAIGHIGFFRRNARDTLWQDSLAVFKQHS